MVGWDLVELLSAGLIVPAQDILSVIAAIIALTFGHALLAGAVLAPAYAWALKEQRLPSLLVAFGQWLRNLLRLRDPHQAIATHATLLAAPFALAAFPAVAVPISIRIHDAVRVALNAAGASLLVHVAAAIAATLVFFAFQGLWTSVLTRLCQLRFLYAWLARPWITASSLVLLSLALTITALVLSRRVLSALDLGWARAVLTVVVVGALLAWLRTLPNLGLVARRSVGFGTLALMLLLSLGATFGLRYSNNARAMLVSHTTFGALFNTSQTAAFDWDGDGYTTLFGGNDCAPWDASIHPGALDIPYNDIDEDCSGEDLTYDAAPPVRQWDHDVPASIPRRPHIILLTVDALNPKHLGFNGYERAISPNLDAMAKRSVRFSNAYAQGPSTRLSFPSLFTSLYDTQIKRAKHGRIPLALLPENLTLAEIFRDAGYRTIAVPPTPYFTGWGGFTQGFQVVDDSPTHVKGPHTSQAVSDAVISQLEEAKDGGKPFLLWAHYYDPHGPFDQPPDSPVFGKRSVDVYDAEIHHTDKHIGRVLAWIAENLEDKDRLVVVTADHGESFDERHPTKHHGYDLHTDVLRVPLLFDMPGFTPRTVNGLVSLMDITPTLVNLARLKGKYDFEGTSLLPALLRDEGLENRVTFHTFFLPEEVKRDRDPLRLVAARTVRYNLIHDRQSNVYSLYDFTVDPVEKDNLFDGQPQIASALRAQLQLWTFRVVGGNTIPAAPPAEP
jgi:arylsulfatase A-like enzyme